MAKTCMYNDVILEQIFAWYFLGKNISHKPQFIHIFLSHLYNDGSD